MRICLYTGHGILVNNVNTSAIGFKSEHYYLKELASCVERELNKYGFECDLMLTPDSLFKSTKQLLSYKVMRANILEPDTNKYRYDLVIELHLNYSDDEYKHGTCCYFQSGNTFGYLVSTRLCNEMEKLGYTNLGINSPRLILLNQCKPTTVVFEVFYCTSKRDCFIANANGLHRLAESIVRAINNGPYKGKDDKINNKHGWYLDGDKAMYYFNGEKLVNTVRNITNKYYYFDEEGYLSTGLKQIGNDIYYFNKHMIIDDIAIVDGNSLQFDTNGRLVTDISKNICYCDLDNKFAKTLYVYPDEFLVKDIKPIVTDKKVAVIRKSDLENYTDVFEEVIEYGKV